MHALVIFNILPHLCSLSYLYIQYIYLWVDNFLGESFENKLQTLIRKYFSTRIPQIRTLSCITPIPLSHLRKLKLNSMISSNTLLFIFRLFLLLLHFFYRFFCLFKPRIPSTFMHCIFSWYNTLVFLNLE